MNAAHWHLAITHLPVLGGLFGLCLLLLALLQRSQELTRTSLLVFLAAGIAAVPTYLTGQPAGDMLMKMIPTMSMDPGDQHAEVAVLALVCSLILGAGSLTGLLAYRKPKLVPPWFIAVTLVLALLTTATMSWAANLGGKIRHPEILTAPESKIAR